MTGMTVNVVKDKIENFMDKYLTKKPASLLEKLFPRLRLTDLGNDALQVFEGVYGNDLDCLSLKKQVSELESQRTKKDYQLIGQENSK